MAAQHLYNTSKQTIQFNSIYKCVSDAQRKTAAKQWGDTHNNQPKVGKNNRSDVVAMAKQEERVGWDIILHLSRQSDRHKNENKVRLGLRRPQYNSFTLNNKNICFRDAEDRRGDPWGWETARER